jgi:hypothetical protein
VGSSALSSDVEKIFEVMSEASEVLGEDGLKEMLKKISEGKNKGYWKGKRRSEIAKDFHEFFDKKFPNSKKDLFRNVIYTSDIDKYTGWTPIENHKKYIEGICAEYGLSPAFMERHLASWSAGMMPELLVDIPEWDGKDHIGEALKKITVTNIDHAYFTELMKDWFSRVVRRMYQPKVQNRLPVFRGRQGLGKDFCIRAMTAGFERYVNEIDFQQSNKTEVYRLIKNLAVGIIPEFDETNSSSISVLKSVITAESIELRALYKNESESVPIRTSFISASNFEDVLRDSSGNRRFMLFDISHIEHSFEQVDGPQIAAQSFELAKQKFKASPEAEKLMNEILVAETPISPDKLFIEEIKEHLRDIKTNGTIRPRWFQIADHMEKIGRKYKFGIRRSQQIMQRSGLTHHDNKGRYYDVKEENDA